MKIAIMQPYFMPYIGYFQLMAAVDKFILLDDVNYIKGGWINRNRILSNAAPAWMTIPLLGASPNKLIREIEIQPDNGWKRKTLTQVKQSYSKAPFCDSTLRHFESWIEIANGNLSSSLYRVLKDLAEILNIGTEIVPSSSIFSKDGLSGVDRVINICFQTGATHYINAPGGKTLYDSEVFRDRGIFLEFIEPKNPELNPELLGTENLSILHLIMHMPFSGLKHAVNKNIELV
jgi:hypothetical protein